MTKGKYVNLRLSSENMIKLTEKFKFWNDWWNGWDCEIL